MHYKPCYVLFTSICHSEQSEESPLFQRRRLFGTSSLRVTERSVISMSVSDEESPLFFSTTGKQDRDASHPLRVFGTTRKALILPKMIEGGHPSLTLGVTVKSLGWQKKLPTITNATFIFLLNNRI